MKPVAVAVSVLTLVVASVLVGFFAYQSLEGSNALTNSQLSTTEENQTATTSWPATVDYTTTISSVSDITVYINVSDSGSGVDSIGASTQGVSTVYVPTTLYSTVTENESFTTTVTSISTQTLVQTVTLPAQTTTETVYWYGETTDAATTTVQVVTLTVACSGCATVNLNQPGRAPVPMVYAVVSMYPLSGAGQQWGGWMNASQYSTSEYSVTFPLGTVRADWTVGAVNSNATLQVWISGVAQPVTLVPMSLPLPNGSSVPGYGASGMWP